ncbi:MAG: fused response regulator/phosphatase [Desulfobacterales bacterium]|nr:fused response regulator/phosphatase [Desulfobacterales bacterium]
MTSQRHILIVDDIEFNRIYLKDILESRGFIITESEDGQDALEKIQHLDTNFDLVITDIMMPIISGIDLVKQLREDGNDIPVIAITAGQNRDTVIQLLKLGCDDYFEKPFVPSTLLKSVEFVLNKSELKKAQKQLIQLNNEIETQFLLSEKILETSVRNDIIPENITYFLKPWRKVSGDIMLCSELKNDRQVILFADLSGHGLSAAISAIPLIYLFNQERRTIFNLIHTLNSFFKNNMPVSIFLCLSIIEIDYKTGKVKIFHAAMPDGFIFNSNGIQHRFSSQSPPLGILSNEHLTITFQTFFLEPGDCILLFSDGLIEAVNKQNEPFGMLRLEDALNANKKSSMVIEDLKSMVELHMKDIPQQDDISAVCIEYKNQVKVCGNAVEFCQPMPIPWKISGIFDSSVIKFKDIPPYQELVEDYIESHPILKTHKVKINLILAELYNNALDYGLLRLDCNLKKEISQYPLFFIERENRLSQLKEGHIRIDLVIEIYKDIGKLTIRIEDTGHGFDYQNFLNQPIKIDGFSQRGLYLVKSICHSLNFNETGNVVEAIYMWKEE